MTAPETSGLYADLTASKRAARVRESGEALLDDAPTLAVSARDLVQDAGRGRDDEAARVAAGRALRAEVDWRPPGTLVPPRRWERKTDHRRRSSGLTLDFSADGRRRRPGGARITATGSGRPGAKDRAACRAPLAGLPGPRRRGPRDWATEYAEAGRCLR